MKTDIETLQNSFWMGYDAYSESKREAIEVWDMYHNRQWSEEAISILRSRGQPVETFNIIKLFARMLVGYYSTTINNIVADPVQTSDITTASLLSDTIRHVFEDNNMESEGDHIKLSGIVSGLMCTEQVPEKTGARDRFGRPIYRINIQQVPDYELVLDPLSTKSDYSDGRFIHRFRWLPEESVVKMFGKKKTKELVAYYNYLEVDEAEFYFSKDEYWYGRYRVFDNFLITHTVIEDDGGKRWSIYWCGNVELSRKEITFKEVRWPYRVVRLQSSDKSEYYGIFREVVETQKAINQALIKLQLMVNTQKVFVEKTAVADVSSFTDAVNRVNGVIPVLKLSGIQVENLSKEAIEQYQIIDQAFNRIQRMLNINDSFLGMAFASDSGRKVKLQQNATIMALRYLTVRIELFYQLLGKDLAGLIKQYYTAEQVLRVSDEVVGQRFIQLNQPMMEFTGNLDPATGEPQMQPIFEQVYDPENGKPLETEEGALVMAPVPEDGTELAFAQHDIRVEAVNYDDQDERVQLMLETVMSGQMGQMLAQVNPSGFFQVSSFALRVMKTKYSPEIAGIFEQTAQMLQGNAQDEDAAAIIAGQTAQPSGGDDSKGMSSQLKLPTNTNEAPV